MAHQPHDICWDVAASSLTYWSSESIDSESPTNFYVLVKPKEVKELHIFAESFARNIEQHTQTERQKYEETYKPPSPGDIVINDRIARKITPTVHKWRQTYDWEFADGIKEGKQLCQHKDTGRITDCGCALPFRERKASAFLRQYQHNDCFQFYALNKEGFYNLQVIETLLIYGEMDPILWVCSHPDTGYKRWKTVDMCGCGVSRISLPGLYQLSGIPSPIPV